jgi:hypothetical protein
MSASETVNVEIQVSKRTMKAIGAVKLGKKIASRDDIRAFAQEAFDEMARHYVEHYRILKSGSPEEKSHVSASFELARTDLCRAFEARRHAEDDLSELWSRFDKQMRAEAQLAEAQLEEALAENKRLRDLLGKHDGCSHWSATDAWFLKINTNK